jgi:hypothetical protein
LSSFDLTQAFNFSIELPLIKQQKEITNVLSNFSVASQEIKQILEEFTAKNYGHEGIPVKKFLLAIELAQE